MWLRQAKAFCRPSTIGQPTGILQEQKFEDLYVEMSGTTMADAARSGILAAFLSIRREFIGFPDRVKAMLLKGCTDLGRDPYMQGAGMPNLIRMLSDC